MPPEQYLLFRQAISTHSISTVVIGFYDFQLTEAAPTKPYDLEGNRAISLDPRIAATDAESVYDFNWAERSQFRILRSLPLIAYRSHVWKYVELLRRSLGEVGVPKLATNSLGRVSDFNALESSSADEFNKEALRFSAHPTSLNESMERILGESRCSNLQVILLLMPASPYHREAFYSQKAWNEYLQALRCSKELRGLGFIDASQWFLSENDFADRLHLGLSRTNTFSQRLAREIVLQLNR
jgi:hypothetical protein